MAQGPAEASSGAVEPWAPRSPLLARALFGLVVLACLACIGAMLILPEASKTVGLVYGGF
jgi:hypothetical protein